MEKIYVIVMLCVDGDDKYIDYVNMRFDSIEKARKEMLVCAKNEYDSLVEMEEHFELVNTTDYISIYDENKELVTRYEIIEI